jgi:hypothetical protein
VDKIVAGVFRRQRVRGPRHQWPDPAADAAQVPAGLDRPPSPGRRDRMRHQRHRGRTGPSTLEIIEENIVSMAEQAQSNKIKVIPGSVPPSVASKNHVTYLDYYSAQVSAEKGMKPEYSEEGVHPNKAGYLIMEKIAEPVIRKHIGKKG